MTKQNKCERCGLWIANSEDVIIDPETDCTYHPHCAREMMECN